MNCRDIDGMLVERPPASPFSAEVEDHVRGCMRCRALVSALGTFAPGDLPSPATLRQIESGIIASWYQNCGDENATELFPFHWDVVGQSPVKVVMGKGSGIDSVKNGLKNLGVQFTEEEAMRVVAAVKDFSLKHKRLLTDAEFRSIVTTTIPSSVAGSTKGVKTAV